MPPLDVYRVQGDDVRAIMTDETAIACTDAPVAIAPGETSTVTMAPWKYSLFGELGTYEIRLPDEIAQPTGSGAVATVPVRVELYEPGMTVKLFRTFITKPFLNFLVLIAGALPDHNLGIAIIVLTLLVKLLLFWPTQRSLEGQKKMQMLQPKLEQLKKQYEGDPKKLQEETVKLWKQEKVNPFQSCLPILLQFPILIGLFYVIRDGSTLELSREFLYSTSKDISWSFGTHFLWLDLRAPNKTFMPILLVALQFIQMRLTFAVASRKAKSEGKATSDAQQTQQKIMQYVLPLMIGVFAFQFPAAVALYWGVSTIFAIGQQMIVNREHLRLKTKIAE
jgi:YidC/Oxa1 family membrane protein insertase